MKCKTSNNNAVVRNKNARYPPFAVYFCPTPDAIMLYYETLNRCDTIQRKKNLETLQHIVQETKMESTNTAEFLIINTRLRAVVYTTVIIFIWPLMSLSLLVMLPPMKLPLLWLLGLFELFELLGLCTIRGLLLIGDV